MVANVKPSFEPAEVTEFSARAGRTLTVGQTVSNHGDPPNGSGASDINTEGTRPVIDRGHEGDGAVSAEIWPRPEGGKAAAAGRQFACDRQLRQTACIRNQ